MTVIITTRYASAGYIAKAMGYGKQASSTSSAQFAAEACAAKVANGRPHKLTLTTQGELSAVYQLEIDDQEAR